MGGGQMARSAHESCMAHAPDTDTTRLYKITILAVFGLQHNYFDVRTNFSESQNNHSDCFLGGRFPPGGADSSVARVPVLA